MIILNSGACQFALSGAGGGIKNIKYQLRHDQELAGHKKLVKQLGDRENSGCCLVWCADRGALVNAGLAQWSHQISPWGGI